jgi:cellulose synthase/poly-beta-1,6-N-acetylglucosamine synthase-like glycosyltransferase
MPGILSWFLAIVAAALAVPAGVFSIEVFVVLFARGGTEHYPNRDPKRRVAILVPARNESAHIAPTLSDIKAQMSPADSLLVIADNCTDDTAEVARRLGADVVERHDQTRIGKGYALDFGLHHLESNPPDIVVMIDADCRLGDGAVEALISACSATGRPTQGLYLMTAPLGASVNQQIAEFAWRVKNWVRPLGLADLHLPCQLMGAGMAFPWKVIRSVNLASGWIVEDLKLGLDLAAAGHAPLFCPSARVTSQFANSARGADIQRRRWEHGHIVTILKTAPRTLLLAVSHGNFNLLTLTLDMAVPPLSLLTLLLVMVFVLTGIAAILGLPSTAFIISAASLFGFAAAVILAWCKYGYEVVSPGAILSIPKYILRKLGLYRQVLWGKTITHWIGTDRAKS